MKYEHIHVNETKCQSKNEKQICNKKSTQRHRVKIEDYFSGKVSIGTTVLKKILLENGFLTYKCAICGITKWNDKDICLELHHIDGDNKNNSLENLQLICPNCHSQTHNFRNKNAVGKNNWVNNIDEEKFVDIMRNSRNIRQGIIKYNELNKKSLPLSGNFYYYVKKILCKHNVFVGEDIIECDIENDIEIKTLEKLEVIKKQRIINEAKIQKQLEKEKKTKEIVERRNEIITKLKLSNISFSKFGWCNEAAKIIGISPQKSRKWILNNCPEIFNGINVFTRKQREDKYL